MPAGNFLQNKLIDWAFRGQAMPASPANTFIAILTCTKGLRQNSFALALNDTITLLANNGTRRLYKCTTAGTTAAAQSTLYPGVANEVITDGTAVLTDQDSVLRLGATGATFVEPIGGAYARVSVAGALTSWKSTQNDNLASTGTLGQTTNTVVVTFPTATADWIAAPGMAWGFAVLDAVTAGAGNLIVQGYLNTPQAIVNGNTVSFAAGQLVIPIQGNGL